VDLDRRVLTVVEAVADVGGRLVAGTTKTGRTRTVPIPEGLVPLLRQQVEGKAATNLVFEGPRGGPWRHSWFYPRYFRPACERIGRPDLRFHDLRHTYASWLLGQGIHPRTAMELLGHSSIQLNPPHG
jgi:integrase